MLHWLRIWVSRDFVSWFTWWLSLFSLGLALLTSEWNSSTVNCSNDWWMLSMLSKWNKAIGIVCVPWLALESLFSQKILWIVVLSNWVGSPLGWLRLRTILAEQLFLQLSMVPCELLFDLWRTILNLLEFLFLSFVELQRALRQQWMRAWRQVHHQPEFEDVQFLLEQLLMPIRQWCYLQTRSISKLQKFLYPILLLSMFSLKCFLRIL